MTRAETVENSSNSWGEFRNGMLTQAYILPRGLWPPSFITGAESVMVMDRSNLDQVLFSQSWIPVGLGLVFNLKVYSLFGSLTECFRYLSATKPRNFQQTCSPVIHQIDARTQQLVTRDLWLYFFVNMYFGFPVSFSARNEYFMAVSTQESTCPLPASTPKDDL